MVRFTKDENGKRVITRNNNNNNINHNGPFVAPRDNNRENIRRNNNNEEYNSDDEHRPPSSNRSIVKKIDDEGVKHVTVGQLRECLAKEGLEIVIMPPDGNCLFHSVADQIYGDHEYHDVVRKLCMDYMEKERNHYSQFITQDFNSYIARKRQNAVHGNHLELQAITEIYSRPVEIYAIDEKPLNIFQGSYDVDNPPIMLSYHYGNHYNSVRNPLKPTAGFGLGLPGLKTAKEIDNDNLKEAIKESEREEISQIIAQNMENDLENVEESLINMAKKESAQELDKFEDFQEQTIMNDYLMQSELEIMQEALERSIMEQSMREYYNSGK